MRSLTRPRSASPMLMLFPEIRRVISMPSNGVVGRVATFMRGRPYSDLASAQSRRRGVAGTIGYGGRRAGIAKHALFVAAALHRGRNSHGLPVFRHGAAGDINAGFPQSFHDGVVREDGPWALGIDQLLDVVADRLRRMGLAAVGRRDRRGEKILQFKTAAIGRHVFVGGHARHRRFVHLDRVRHRFQVERSQDGPRRG